MKKKNKLKQPLTKKMSSSKAVKQVLKENKPLFAAFGTGFVLILVIGSTFAWSSFSSWVKNHMQSEVGTLEVKIIEDYEQDSVFDLGKEITKKVDVRNMSKYPAIVRVQFIESAANFKIDDKTGMLEKKTTQGGSDLAIKDKAETWKVGAVYPDQFKKVDFYVINQSEINYQTKYKEDATRPKLLKPFEITYSPTIKEQPTPPPAQVPYWVYENGFFYYSQVLEGNKQSEVSVMESVKMLKENLVNPSKNMLYKIDVNAYGIRANEGSLEKWTTNQALIDMYKADPKFEE